MTMALMNNMMKGMISALSVEEREEMMLKMMPAMMKGVDMAELAPKMAPTMGRQITLTGLVLLLLRASEDEELGEKLKNSTNDCPTRARRWPG
jgi:flagellar motor component MotA